MRFIRSRPHALGLAVTLLVMLGFQTSSCLAGEPATPPGAPAAQPGSPARLPRQPSEKPGSAPSSIPQGDSPQVVTGFDAAVVAYRFLLEAVVTEAGLVRYDKLAGNLNLEMLKNVVRLLGEVELPKDRLERMAFLCNAYNANVMFNALNESRKSGFQNVLAVRGFFDEQLITVADERMTLNQLEKKLQSMGDPRIHAALVCAAMSSPALRREPYAADHLEAQLDDQCRRWINDPTKNHLEANGAALSMILDWHKDDFNIKPYGDRIGFVLKYADPESPIAQYLKTAEKPAILWEPYDWSLNAAPVVSLVTPALSPAPAPAPTPAPAPAPATAPAPAQEPAKP